MFSLSQRRVNISWCQSAILLGLFLVDLVNMYSNFEMPVAAETTLMLEHRCGDMDNVREQVLTENSNAS